MVPGGNNFYWRLKLMDLNLPWVLWASSMPRPQVWLHPIPLGLFPLKSVPLANAKIKPDAQLRAAPAKRAGGALDLLRSKMRAVIFSPSGKDQEGLKRVPKVPLFLFGTSVALAVWHKAHCSTGASLVPAPLPSLKPGSSSFRENKM